MKRRPRIYYTESQKALMWERWRKGDSLHQIDLLCGSKSSQIATLVERQSRYVMLVKLTAKDTETVTNALIKNARNLPQELYKSLTWDRGKEMAAHKRFTLATDIKVYFCDPHQPWQRGTARIRTGYCGSISPRASTFRPTRKPSLKP